MTFLKKELIQAGYKVEEPVNGIIVVENFIKENELVDLKKIIDSATEDDWQIHYRQQLKHFCLEKFGRDDVQNLVAEGKYEITQNWDDKNLLISDKEPCINIVKRISDLIYLADPSLNISLGIFQRMQEGVELKAHTDQHTDPSIKYAAVLYVNDDYIDGEIFWPNKNLTLKPKPGSLVIFPGDDEYHHGVKHVGKGPIRYVMPGFIRITDFYKRNKY